MSLLSFSVYGYDPILETDFEKYDQNYEDVLRIVGLMSKIGETPYVDLENTNDATFLIDGIIEWYEIDTLFWESFGLQNPLSFDQLLDDFFMELEVVHDLLRHGDMWSVWSCDPDSICEGVAG